MPRTEGKCSEGKEQYGGGTVNRKKRKAVRVNVSTSIGSLEVCSRPNSRFCREQGVRAYKCVRCVLVLRGHGVCCGVSLSVTCSRQCAD